MQFALVLREAENPSVTWRSYLPYDDGWLFSRRNSRLTRSSISSIRGSG
jgi:hypothetical protein